MNVSVADLVVAVASETDAPAMVEVIHAAFGARPALDPPSTAIDETPASVAAALRRGGGIVATVDGRPAGALLVARTAPEVAGFQRVSVHPEYQRHGIASAMVAAAQDYAAELGCARVELFARAELAELVDFWRHRGYAVLRPGDHGFVLGRDLPVAFEVPTAHAMQDLGGRLAELLRPGDVLIATGDLGAGKTTLTQGIGRGLGSDGPVISPTFVLSRVHPSTTGRPTLVHVDAYRLTGPDELDDLDLDAAVPQAVTVVEWGAGVAEGLSEDRLEVDIRRTAYPYGSDHDADSRTVLLRPVGPRWAGVDLRGLRAGR